MSRRYLPIAIVSLVVALFFGKLFVPTPKLFYTPDYGQSDIWQQNYPFKELLSRSLKQGTLPFWTREIGGGFPVFAEGQTGSLFFPNLLLFATLPTWLAWNLSYVVIFFLACWGAYLFCRHLGVSAAASLVAALSFGFGGYFVTKIVHINYIQSASLTPWLFYLGNWFWEKPSWKPAFWFGFILAQQIFTGGFQWVFMTLVGLSVFLLMQFRERDLEALLRKMFLFSLVVLFGLVLAAPQLLPTLEFNDASYRSGGLSRSQIFQFPYSAKHLITLLLPNALGTPRDGTYPSPFGKDSLGIYWENTAYVGLLPLAASGLAMLRKRRDRRVKALIFLGVASLLLALGKNSPLAFLFTYSGFNWFRVPSRFLILVTLSLISLAGFGLDWFLAWIRKRAGSRSSGSLIIPALLAISVVDLFFFGYHYHPLVEVEKALEAPPVLAALQEEGRIYTLPDQGTVWNDVFLTRGWQEIEPFLYFKNSLEANLNLLYGKSQLSVSTAFQPLRQDLAKIFAPDLLSAANVRYIISPGEIKDAKDLELVLRIDPPSDTLPTYVVYSNQKALDRFRISTRYEVGLEVFERLGETGEETFSFSDTVVFEKEPNLTLERPTTSEISVLEDNEQRLIVSTRTDKEALLVIADSYFPGWEAILDNAEVEILPVNINQRAVALPAGEHRVDFRYVPRQFRVGVVAAVAALGSFGILALVTPRLGRYQSLVKAIVLKRRRG